MENQQKPTKKRYLKQKQKLFIEEYLKNFGNISKSCRNVKINRSTFYSWQEDSLFEEKFQEAIEEHNDLVYQRILEMAINGNERMLVLWAKYMLKNRGFIDSKENVPIIMSALDIAKTLYHADELSNKT